MKTAIALTVAAAASLWGSAALACGAPYGAGVNVDPHQDIIVSHKSGKETYVFQPTFCGNAKDFGLILPVPAPLAGVPELGDEKAFTAVIDISKPTIVNTTQCTSRGGVGGSDGLDAGSFGGGGATVVATGHVGFLDWSQIKADSTESLTAWLDTNGYTYSASAKPAFDSYVTKGWYFVAFKVNQGAPTGTDNCRALGPIKVSFPTADPVIPSRIATAGQTLGSLFSWRIFAISDAASGQIGFLTVDGNHRPQFAGALDETDVKNLGGLASAGDRLTKLAVFFDGSETNDLTLIKSPTASDFRETQYAVTYVDCDDAGPAEDSGAPVAVDNGAVESKGCSTSGSRGGLLSFAGLALVAAAIARVRRARS